jgi:MFS family permease
VADGGTENRTVTEERSTPEIRRRTLAVGLVLSTSLVAFEVTSVLTALPTISDELDGDSLYGATLAAYMLANLVGLVAAGERVDRHGPRRPFVVCIAIFVVGLLLAGIANDMWVVLVGRVVQGLGAGGLAPISFALIAKMWSNEERSRILAWVSAGWVLPSLAAPGLAGWITNEVDWRWVFVGIAPLALVTATIVLSALGSTTAVPTTADPTTDAPRVRGSRVPSAFRLALGVGAIIAGVQSPHLWFAIVCTIVGVIIGVPAFRRLMPSGVLRARPGLAAILACRTLATAAFLGADSFIPLAADRIHGESATVQGFVIIGAALAWSLGSAVSSRRSGSSTLVGSSRLGFALLMIGLIGVLPVLSPNWSLLAVFFTWSVAGLGMGFLFVPTSAAALDYADSGSEGIVGSQINLADNVGFALMGGLGGATVAASDRTQWPLSHALASNLILGILLAMVGLLLARRITRRPSSGIMSHGVN